MEWSLMNFHQERMKNINDIIDDLWRQIYRGNDIDTIKIIADNIDGGSGGEKRRTYNYRVVQVRKDVELELRGRCSAGQKVLACLIIRMALAETFSSNCGVLALDEPTTNLDEKNIESLSYVLTQIVTKRMQQKNFQLILITHDNNFLNMLTRLDEINHYYEVKRNEL
ncbi:hypothetical protein AAG570_011095 [Ranatra chinensis]|uniref:DNA repair protein RAD50 n=1 Tax=Ranatra chinensis TaxID=642074 RepID=A0ABD0YJK7_9HEMI